MRPMHEDPWKVAGMNATLDPPRSDPLLRELKKLNSELMILANYQSLLERRITRVFAMLEKRMEREGNL